MRVKHRGINIDQIFPWLSGADIFLAELIEETETFSRLLLAEKKIEDEILAALKMRS